MLFKYLTYYLIFVFYFFDFMIKPILLDYDNMHEKRFLPFLMMKELWNKNNVRYVMHGYVRTLFSNSTVAESTVR
jgi:hypothetical protein